MNNLDQSAKNNIVDRLKNILNNIIYLLGRYLARFLERVPAIFESIDQFFQGWNDQKSILVKNGATPY